MGFVTSRYAVHFDLAAHTCNIGQNPSDVRGAGAGGARKAAQDMEDIALLGMGDTLVMHV